MSSLTNDMSMRVGSAPASRLNTLSFPHRIDWIAFEPLPASPVPSECRWSVFFHRLDIFCTRKRYHLRWLSRPYFGPSSSGVAWSTTHWIMASERFSHRLIVEFCWAPWSVFLHCFHKRQRNLWRFYGYDLQAGCPIPALVLLQCCPEEMWNCKIRSWPVKDLRRYFCCYPHEPQIHRSERLHRSFWRRCSN